MTYTAKQKNSKELLHLAAKTEVTAVQKINVTT